MNNTKHRNKKKILKFLKTEQLEELERPLAEYAKSVSGKDINELSEKDKIAFRDFALLSLVYACALRISEAVNLRLNNLILEEGEVIIVDSKGDDRIVDIPLPIIDILKEWLRIRPDFKENEYVFTRVRHSTKTNYANDNLPLRRQYYNNLIKKLAIETGITLKGEKDVKLPHPHTLRHSRAMAIYDDGIELDVIQQILGHKDLRTTQVYAHAKREQIRKVQMNNTKGIISL